MSQTKEYNKFNLLDYNRNLNSKQINKLKDSITKHGYLNSNPIIVDQKMNIIDGQHRFTACKEMGLPIIYEIVDNSNEMIIDLNTTQKKWSLDDYVNYYATRYNNKNYLRLQRICKKTNLRPNTVMTILKGSTSGDIAKEVKFGNLRIKEEDEIRISSTLETIINIANSLRIKLTTRYIEAILQLSRFDNFKWKKMIEQSDKYPTLAYNCITREDYIEMLKRIYNYQSKTIRTKI